ncbi:flagellar biosynthesis repressor FlbT [Arenibaculum pallidiluteum]|uniref:flagellar biosynthesis repressor FlbT n=1 Tax=Arenibaculum pallidiluteum TaxID=2812559 RepID=UPI001A963C80|nr:flagellar biosynthesis repressor FlbT [Arenibaculum pallidiluteum]
MIDSIELKKLPLKAGETVLVNGTPIRLEGGELMVPASAKVVTRAQLLKDVAQANTATKRIYFILQAMSLDPTNGEAYRRDLMALIDDRAENSTLVPVLKSLALIAEFARLGDNASALEICRHLIDFDDAVVRDFPATAEAAA